MLASCALKCGWAATTIDISHDESLKVIKAPLPGMLVENSSIILRNLFPLNVTVILSQFVSLMLPKNGSGLPRFGFFWATLYQSSPEIGFSTGLGAGVL